MSGGTSTVRTVKRSTTAAARATRITSKQLSPAKPHATRDSPFRVSPDVKKIEIVQIDQKCFVTFNKDDLQLLQFYSK